MKIESFLAGIGLEFQDHEFPVRVRMEQGELWNFEIYGIIIQWRNERLGKEVVADYLMRRKNS